MGTSTEEELTNDPSPVPFEGHSPAGSAVAVEVADPNTTVESQDTMSYDLALYASFPAAEPVVNTGNGDQSPAPPAGTTNSLARAPSRLPPGQVTIPMAKAAYPSTNFREIDYPGLSDAIAPFSAEQTAHLRAIIPNHVRLIVENPPEVPPLPTSGATHTGVTREQAKTDWELAYQIYLEYYLADIVFPPANGGDRKALPKRVIKALVARDPRMENRPSIRNAT